MLGNVRIGRIIVFFLDLLYMTVLAVSCSVFSYAFNNGVFRLFIGIPMALGFALYYNTVGRLVLFFSEAVIRFIRAVFRCIVVTPAKWILRTTGAVLKWLYRHTIVRLYAVFIGIRKCIYTEKQKNLLKKQVRF